MNIKKSVEVMNARIETTKQALASHLGITTPYLSKLLKENDSRHIAKMAEFYHLQVSDFIAEGE